MLRRTTSKLVLRRTQTRLSGGDLYHPPKLEDIPDASTTRGFFGAYKNSAALLRLIDLKWMMNRAVQLGREHYIAAPTLYLFVWMFCWKGFVIAKYGDGAPPRQVDWNTEETGYLPSNFTPTQCPRVI